MVINGTGDEQLNIDGTTLSTVSELRFLGVIIDKFGYFRPQKEDYSKALWSLFHRVKQLGLSCFPQAYIKAYQTFI